MTVTFCGHAEVQEPDAVRSWLQETVASLIVHGADTFYLGGYGGFDRMAAAVVREWKLKYPHISSLLVLPYLDRKVEDTGYDGTVYPPLETTPRRYAIARRNEYQVDWSDIVVAYVLYSWGGTATTLKYAERKKKEILRYRKT